MQRSTNRLLENEPIFRSRCVLYFFFARLQTDVLREALGPFRPLIVSCMAKSSSGRIFQGSLAPDDADFIWMLDLSVDVQTVEGVILKDGSRLSYKMSGHAAFWTTLAAT